MLAEEIHPLLVIVPLKMGLGVSFLPLLLDFFADEVLLMQVEELVDFVGYHHLVLGEKGGLEQELVDGHSVVVHSVDFPEFPLDVLGLLENVEVLVLLIQSVIGSGLDPVHIAGKLLGVGL